MLTNERIWTLWGHAVNSPGATTETFARAVERATLEEAAKVCMAFLHNVPDDGGDDLDRIGRYSNGTVMRCAAAIRALIDKEPRT